LTLFVAFVSMSHSTRANFHLWDIKEIFTSADGSVQFIELFTTSAGQGVLNAHLITATSDGVSVPFTFNRNLVGNTANRHFLLATAGFGSLAGGVTPDYTIPANFFNPSAANISINFANWDTVTFPGSLLPTDGVMSLTDQSPAGTQNFVAGVNSPTNFASAVGSVDLSPPPAGIDGDYNDNGTVEQADLDLVLLNWGAAAEPPPDGWVNDLPAGSIDQAELDGVLLNWGNMVAGSTAVPEPSAVVLVTIIVTTMLIAAIYRRGRVAAH
jgi:hypothetical protein